MKEITQDELWGQSNSVHRLILEHQMAAARGQFAEFFMPLYAMNEYRPGLYKGELPGSKFLLDQFLPLCRAIQCQDSFAADQIFRRYCLIFNQNREELRKNPGKKLAEMRKIRDALSEQLAGDATLFDLLQLFRGHFEIPEILKNVLEESEEPFLENSLESAWQEALKTPFPQLEKWANYVKNEMGVHTQHSVKGLEYDRVMVILSDSEARGKTRFETLFSESRKGEDSAVARLFYVVCSRAMKSLAIVFHTRDVEKIRRFVLNKELFLDQEITNFPQLS